MVSTILLVILLDIVSIYVPGLMPPEIHRQTDLSGSMNVAAALAASAGFAAGGIAILRGLEHQGHDRLSWFVVGAGCVSFALIDLLFDGRGGVSLMLPIGGIAAVLFLLIHRQVRASGIAVRLLLVAFLLAASNPVVDAGEREIMGEPDNYRFVSAHHPYELTDSAWRTLELVRQVQEGTELLVIAFLFCAFLPEVGAPEPLMQGLRMEWASRGGIGK